MTEKAPPKSRLKQVRLLAWALIALALIGIVALWVVAQERCTTGGDGGTH